MRVNLPIAYSQLDSRWGALLLGFNTSSQFDIANYGCWLTDLSDICTYFGFTENPQTLNDAGKALAPGIFFAGASGDYCIGGITKVHKEITEARTLTPNLLTDAQINEIKSALDANLPVVVEIANSPKVVKAGTHFVTLVDYDINDENNFTIQDPVGARTHSLKDYLGLFQPSFRKDVQQYIIYTGPVPSQQQTVAVPQDVFPNLVHGSAEWDKTVAYLLPSNDPKATQFENVQSAVAGIKSTSTALQTQLTAANTALAEAQQEIKNRIEQVSRLQDQLTKQADGDNAEITALNKQADLAGVVVQQLKGTIAGLQLEVDDAAKAKGKALNDLAACQASSSAPSTTQIDTTVTTVFTHIQSIFDAILKRITALRK